MCQNYPGAFAPFTAPMKHRPIPPVRVLSSSWGWNCSNIRKSRLFDGGHCQELGTLVGSLARLPHLHLRSASRSPGRLRKACSRRSQWLSLLKGSTAQAAWTNYIPCQSCALRHPSQGRVGPRHLWSNTQWWNNNGCTGNMFGLLKMKVH